MAEHDLDRAIDALRTRRSPPAGAQDRVHAALVARLGGPGPGSDDGGLGQAGDAGLGGAASSGGVGFAAKVVGATAALTAAGLLTVKLGALAVASLGASDAGPTSVQVEARPLAEPATVPASVESAQPDASADAPAPAIAEDRSSPPSVPPRARKSADREPAPAAPDIAAELALIEAARAAASPIATIAKLREHAQQFPEGELCDEREALWVIADCQRGELDDAARRAEALAGRRPNSPLLDRIAAACPNL